MYVYATRSSFTQVFSGHVYLHSIMTTHSDTMNSDPFSAETRIFRDNQVSIMAVDVLAPCVARSLAAMVLTAE